MMSDRETLHAFPDLLKRVGSHLDVMFFSRKLQVPLDVSGPWLFHICPAAAFSSSGVFFSGHLLHNPFFLTQPKLKADQTQNNTIPSRRHVLRSTDHSVSPTSPRLGNPYTIDER